MKEGPMDRKIVFINQATGYLTIDIINAFAKSGTFKNVALITGSIRVQDVPLDPRVTWSRINLYDRGNPRKKFLSWLVGTMRIFFLLITRYRKYEVFYITIPPFAYLLSLVVRHRFSVLVFDVYPDVLQIYGVSEKNVIYRMWGKCNRILFRRAHRVYTIGEGMTKLLERYVNRSKITIIPNWTGLTNTVQIEKSQNHFVEAQRLKDKFIVQYSGNIGYTHNVETLVEIARDLQQNNNIFFLIIGRGDKFKMIDALIGEYQLTNCRLLPFQPDSMLNATLSAADLGVVLLDDKTAHVSLPSKIYNLQAAGVPILGIADTESELAYHLKKHGNGECFNARDKESIIQYILALHNDRARHQALRNASRLAGTCYTSRNAETYFDSYVSENLEAFR